MLSKVSSGLLIPFLATWFAGLVAGAAADKNATGITTTVSAVTEWRGPDNRCMIHLKFTGDSLSNHCLVLGAHPLAAMDDTGANLCPTNKSESDGWRTVRYANFTPARGVYFGTGSSTVYDVVSLRASSRSARTIKEVRGELELYSPTFQNGGALIVEDFRAHPGGPIPNAALEKLNMRIICHTKESFEATRQTNQVNDRAFAKVFGVEAEQDQLFPGILNSPQDSPRNYVVLKVSDPYKRLAGFGFCSEGRFLPVASHRSVDNLHNYTFALPGLPAKVSLYVYLNVPEAIERIPFHVENIPLP